MVAEVKELGSNLGISNNLTREVEEKLNELWNALETAERIRNEKVTNKLKEYSVIYQTLNKIEEKIKEIHADFWKKKGIIEGLNNIYYIYKNRIDIAEKLGKEKGIIAYNVFNKEVGQHEEIINSLKKLEETIKELINFYKKIKEKKDEARKKVSKKLKNRKIKGSMKKVRKEKEYIELTKEVKEIINIMLSDWRAEAEHYEKTITTLERGVLSSLTGIKKEFQKCKELLIKVMNKKKPVVKYCLRLVRYLKGYEEFINRMNDYKIIYIKRRRYVINSFINRRKRFLNLIQITQEKMREKENNLQEKINNIKNYIIKGITKKGVKESIEFFKNLQKSLDNYKSTITKITLIASEDKMLKDTTLKELKIVQTQQEKINEVLRILNALKKEVPK